MALCLQETRASFSFLYQFVFCAHSHFFSDIISAKHFLMDGIFESSKSLCNGCGRSVHLSLCFLCFQTCVYVCVVMLKEDSGTFVWCWTFLKCCCKVSRVWIYRWFDHVAWCHNKITPSALQNHSGQCDTYHWAQLGLSQTLQFMKPKNCALINSIDIAYIF